MNTSIPPSKKRGNKNIPPNTNTNTDNPSPINIPELYERGRQDLARSKRHMYCLRELALSSSSTPHPQDVTPSPQKPEPNSVPEFSEAQTKSIKPSETPPSPREELTTKVLNSDRNPAVLPILG
ncbi:hypothetical protein BPOR_0139g00100 [Botrytis porri]|uniref:Uncharacterized protein n=2 Tax=Botrytis porri TaxID=87229 RepID=A0A4Z1KWP5_9HELO|nr:hypothetical protein BPOR_0139g00100 [Botrytis porri]